MAESHSIISMPPLPVQSNGVRYAHVPGFTGYCAGSDGTIWSCCKPNKKSRQFSGMWFQKKQWKNADGYCFVCLLDDDRRERRMFAHSVILLTFVGSRPKGMETLHNNGNPADNSLENIRWGTRQENMEDARRHGTLAIREANGHAKMNALRVRAVNTLLASGWSQDDTASALGVSQPTISAIATGKRWGIEVSHAENN